MAYSEELSCLFEEFDTEEMETLPAISVFKSTCVTEDCVNLELGKRVINATKSDEILPDHLKKPLDSINALQLLLALKSFNNLVTSEMFSSSAKEKAWHNFQVLQPSIINETSKIIPNRQLSAFLSLKTAEEVISNTCPSNPDQSMLEKTFGLESAENDIVLYIAGFVLFRCKKKYTSSEFQKCLQKLTNKDACSKLISVNSRGGLIEPCPEISDFFTTLEVIFRNSCNGMSLPSLQQFTDLISKDNEAVSLFYNCTYHSEPKAEVQEKLFLTIVSLFHKVRCHAKCRQMTENFHMKTKTASKQALRKCID